jgi:hypothetical protein
MDVEGQLNWIKDTDDTKPNLYELANSRKIKPICNIILITITAKLEYPNGIYHKTACNKYILKIYRLNTSRLPIRLLHLRLRHRLLSVARSLYLQRRLSVVIDGRDVGAPVDEQPGRLLMPIHRC